MKKKIIIIAIIVFLLLALGIGGYFIFGNKDKKDDKTKSNTKSKTTITITFDADGGTEVEPMKVKKGEKFELPKTEKKGYFFQGWFDGEVYYSDEDTDKLEKDTTLKALWANPDTPEDDVELKVVFDSKGGSKVKDMTFKCNDGVAVLKNLPKSKKDSYDFLSWEDKNGKSILDGAKIMCDGASLKLYAVWEYDGPVANPEQDPNASKTPKCDSGYKFNGTKCEKEGTVKTKCGDRGFDYNGKCVTLKDSSRKVGTYSCPELNITVGSYAGKEKGELVYAGSYFCYYHKLSYNNESQCTSYTGQYGKFVWRSNNDTCYVTMKNASMSCDNLSGYAYISNPNSYSGVNGLNSGCYPVSDKIKYCENGYDLKDGKCIATADPTYE